MLVTTVLTSEWRRSCLSLQTHARNTSPNHHGSTSINFSHQEKSSETVKRKCHFFFNTCFMFMMMNFFSIYIYVFNFQKNTVLYQWLRKKVPFIVCIKYWPVTLLGKSKLNNAVLLLIDHWPVDLQTPHTGFDTVFYAMHIQIAVFYNNSTWLGWE